MSFPGNAVYLKGEIMCVWVSLCTWPTHSLDKKRQRSNKFLIKQLCPFFDLKSFFTLRFRLWGYNKGGWLVSAGNREQAIIVTLPFNLHLCPWLRMKCSRWKKESRPSLKWFVYVHRWEAAWFTNLPMIPSPELTLCFLFHIFFFFYPWWNSNVTDKNFL